MVERTVMSGVETVTTTRTVTHRDVTYIPQDPREVGLPASGYGSVIPFLYGSAWTYGKMIEIFATGEDTDSVKLTVLELYARQLDPDKTIKLAAIKANGKLIYRRYGGTFFRAPGLNFQLLIGEATQEPPAALTAEYGANNVPGYRDRLCILYQDFPVTEEPYNGTYPVMTAYFVETGDDLVTTDYVQLQGNGGTGEQAWDWDAGLVWTIRGDELLLHARLTDTEIFRTQITGGTGSYIATDFKNRILRYLPEEGRVLVTALHSGNDFARVLSIDPFSGVILAESDPLFDSAAGTWTQTLAVIDLGTSYQLIGGCFLTGEIWASLYDPATETFINNYESGDDWNGHNDVQSIVEGPVVDGEYTVFIAADGTLYKASINTMPDGLDNADEIASYAGTTIRKVWYDASADEVYVWTADSKIRAVSTDGVQRYVETTPYTLQQAENDESGDLVTHRISDGRVFIYDTGDWYITNLRTGTSTLTILPALVDRYVFDGFMEEVHETTTNNLVRYSLGGSVADGASLSGFRTALFERGGFQAAEIVNTNIDDIYTGFLIRDTVSPNDIDRNFAAVFGYDIIESGGFIKGHRPPVGGAFALTATIPVTDLQEQKNAGRVERIRTVRTPDIELPQQWELQYLDRSIDHERSKQYARRPGAPYATSNARDTSFHFVPVIMTATQAKQLAEKALFRIWEGQTTQVWGVAAKHADIEPSDTVSITDGNFTYTAHIFRGTLDPDTFAQSFQSYSYLTDVATDTVGHGGTRPDHPGGIDGDTPDDDSSPGGGSGTGGGGGGTTGYPQSQYIHLDIPIPLAAQDTAGARLRQYSLFAPRVGLSEWTGGTGYYSTDGVTYNPLYTQSSIPIMGIVADPLGSIANPWVIDHTNELAVAITVGDGDTVESITELEMLNNENLAAVGKPGRWEIIQWMTVTEDANGRKVLSDLLRGRLGTEVYIGTGVAGDYFIPLNADVKSSRYPLSYLGDNLYFKVRGVGQTLAQATTTRGIISGAAETPRAPCHLDAVIDGSDIDLTWFRRSRIPIIGISALVTSPPLGEASELYTVEIRDAGNTTTLRTFTGITSPAKTYLAADITTDFGSMPASLTYRARQIATLDDAQSIAGHWATATITL